MAKLAAAAALPGPSELPMRTGSPNLENEGGVKCAAQQGAHGRRAAPARAAGRSLPWTGGPLRHMLGRALLLLAASNASPVHIYLPEPALQGQAKT